MSRLSIARHAALAVIAAIGVGGMASPLVAQRTTPRPALGPPPTPAAPRTPYPGATVIIDPLVHASPRGMHPGRGHQSQGWYGQAPIYYPTAGYGMGSGGVYDTNGRPLWSGYDAPPAAPMMPSGEYGGSTPDLSGSPYTVIDGGTMVVDFGNGDRRAVPSCASVEKASTPDGQPRTIFYRPPAYALVLRAGQSGQVLGRPTAGARVCYSMDAYGRVVLAY
jgi:hypothetical protein